jgi:8-hydroxy-5-deazaflavin:NADPH oxidoreductase
MATIKTIAIVGATTNLGAAIATNLSGKGNYRLLLMSEDLTKLIDLKARLAKSGTEAFAISCARDASWEADIIIVATPYNEEKNVAEKIREVAIGKIVISVSHPLDGSCLRVANSLHSSAAEELQKLLPHSKVVMTCNTLFAADFVTALGRSADRFIAGNNGDAVQTVFEILKASGFNPIIAGDLSWSRTLERMQLQLMQLVKKITITV